MGRFSYISPIIPLVCLLTFFTLKVEFCFSQVQQEWLRLYPDPNTFIATAGSMALDDSGNVYVAGYTENSGSNSICTIKYSSSGVQQWVANYYSNNSGGRTAFSVAVDKSSNVYVTG